METTLGGIETETDKLNNMIDEDSAGNKFTTIALENGPEGGTGLSAQQTRDAMKLTPTVGVPAADSIDADLATVIAKTDGLNFTGTDVKATLDGETVTTDSDSRTASKADVSALALENTLGEVAVQTTRVDALIEDSTGDRFTEKALEEAPSGTGGDATAANQLLIYALQQADVKVVEVEGVFEKHLLIKDTDTILLKKLMKKLNGDPITNKKSTVGQLINKE
jgi:hypothetical protein